MLGHLQSLLNHLLIMNRRMMGKMVMGKMMMVMRTRPLWSPLPYVSFLTIISVHS